MFRVDHRVLRMIEWHVMARDSAIILNQFWKDSEEEKSSCRVCRNCLSLRWSVEILVKMPHSHERMWSNVRVMSLLTYSEVQKNDLKADENRKQFVVFLSLARCRRRLRKKNDAVKSCLAESRIFESAQMKEEMVLFIIRSRSKWQLSACWLRLGRRVRFSSSSTFEWDWCEHFPATKTNNQNRRKTTTQWTQKARIF